MSLTFIVGGARSGKSSFAEKICRDSSAGICYIATSKITDEDMADRVEKHRAKRPAGWTTMEKYSNFNEIEDTEEFNDNDIFLLDCMTIMITNIMFNHEVDYDSCSPQVLDEVEKDVFNEIKELLGLIKKHNKKLIIVSNEVGMGIVPAYRLGAVFRDIAGRVNQFLAAQADEVYNVICGLPQKLK